MNGIDRFLPSVVLDARVMSTGAKPGKSTGTQADSGTASAFGSHLDDLSKQEDTASNSPTLGGSLNHAVPAFVQQSFLRVTVTAEAAGQGTSEPETTVLDTASTIASPQASGKTPDIAIFAAWSATGSDRPLATATGSMIADASQGAREVTLAGGTPTLGTTIAETESSPTGHHPASNAIRDAHAHAIPDNAETAMISPLVVGFPLLSSITAASQETGGGSDGSAASRDAAIAGTASVSCAIGEMLSLGQPPTFAHVSGSAGKLPLAPSLASRGKPVTQDIAEPYASLTADPNGGQGSDFAALAPVRISIVDQQTHFAPSKEFSSVQQLAHPRGGFVPVPVAGDARGLASLGGNAPVVGESTLDNTVTQDSVDRHASHTTDPNSGQGPDSAALAPVKVSIVHQQTSLAPANGLSPAQQIGELITAGVRRKMPVRQPFNRAPRPIALAWPVCFTPCLGSRPCKCNSIPRVWARLLSACEIAGSRLDLRVETERPETTQLIGKERDLLAGKLQAAGYSLETLVIRPAEQQASHQQISVNVPSNGQNQSTGQANEGPSAHDRASTHDDRQRSRPVLADEPQDGAGVRLTGGDPYV